MSKKGVLIVFSAFSGSGKGTVLKELFKENPGQYELSVSATTRSPRVNKETGATEVDGKDYFFITREAFEARIAEDDFLEYADYNGNYYGTPKTYVMSMLEAGKDVILEIEVQGALQVKKNFPDALLLFMTPPSAAELYRRLVDRKTETMEVIAGRMNLAKRESLYMDRYDYILVNDDLKTCVETFKRLVDLKRCDILKDEDLALLESCDIPHNRELIANIQYQLNHIEI